MQSSTTSAKFSSVGVTWLGEGDTVRNGDVPVDGLFLAGVVPVRPLEGQRRRRPRVSAFVSPGRLVSAVIYFKVLKLKVSGLYIYHVYTSIYFMCVHKQPL